MISLGLGVNLPLKYANRHGLISGPSGTGKTVTIMRLADELSAAGVPVFLADVKGDLSAMTAIPGAMWLDPYGRHDTPLRVTVKGMGPRLVARALELSEAQSGAVDVAFAFAAENVLPFDTPAHFDSVLRMMCRNLADVSDRYGHVTLASVGVVRRSLARLSGGPIQGPRFDVATLLHPGRVTVLDATKLIKSPRLYAAVMMHLLEELNDRLPEIGDVKKPILAYVFDEAHLLFADITPGLLLQIEQTVRLIRSKGVGIYFASQSRMDVPQVIREQLATGILHDRERGVGKAGVGFIAESGASVWHQNVKIYLPTRCALEAIAPTLNPEPVSERQARKPDTSRCEQWGAAVLLLIVAALAIYGAAALLGFTVTGTCAGLAGAMAAVWRWGPS